MTRRALGPPAQGIRADVLLVDKGLAKSRTQAQAAIAVGRVSADGSRVTKPSQCLDPHANVSFAAAHPYVSRGGVKLCAALDHFALSPSGKICIDIGVSTGGFTQVLLERGAKRVFAVDAGRGQLAPLLRCDPRIVLLEGVNARLLTDALVTERLEYIVADVSFISLKLVLPSALALAKEAAVLVALFKPQFEVGRAHVGKGGIVRDKTARLGALERFTHWLGSQNGWTVIGTMPSPIAGGDGNMEYFVAASHGYAR